MYDDSARTPASEQLESRIFHFLDSELGSKCTIEEARNYVKLIKQLGKKRLLARQYTEVLLKKANRFIDKRSYAKEKQHIKSECRDTAITYSHQASSQSVVEVETQKQMSPQLFLKKEPHTSTKPQNEKHLVSAFMLDDRRRDKRIDFISSSDNYQDSNSSNERFHRGAKQEVLLYDESDSDDSYDNHGDVESLKSLTEEVEHRHAQTSS